MTKHMPYNASHPDEGSESRSRLNPLVPVSFVRDIYDNGEHGWTLDINHEIPWMEFGQWLERYSQQPMGGKTDAPLFSPTVYNGTRCAENGTTSRMLVLDSDGGLALQTMLTWLRDHQIESIIYNSARHKSAEVNHQDKFRVIILLDETVDTKTQGKAVRALARMLCQEFAVAVGKKEGQWDLDPSRLNAHTLLYVPGRYTKAGEHVFEHIEGDALDPHALIRQYPEPEYVPLYRDDYPDDDAEMIERKAEAAMRVIRNEFQDRGTWIKIGLALKSAFVGSDAHGFELWRQFSREWPDNTEAVIEKEWKSFHPHHVSATTLFWFADQADASWRDKFGHERERWKSGTERVMSLKDMLADLKANPPDDLPVIKKKVDETISDAAVSEAR